jgi:ArpU family phage transcriptional regulator
LVSNVAVLYIVLGRNILSHMGVDRMEQLKFELPELDRKATQKRVEEALEKARIFKQIGYEPEEMKLTPAYTPRFHGQTNEVGSPAEDIAIKNVDVPEMMKKHVERVEWAVRRLGKKEKELITERYLIDDSVPDYDVYNNVLHISERTYYRIKWRAFYKLAFALKLEVIKGNES